MAQARLVLLAGCDPRAEVVPVTGVIREYLEAELAVRRTIHDNWPGHYLSIGDLVLQEGVEFKYEPYDATRWRFKGNERECFRNALLLAHMWPEELTYVEGYALGVIPTPHAWCATKDKIVVDPTWDPDQAREYLGIPFTFRAADRITSERGKYGVLDDWENDWPLLREPLDPSLVATDLKGDK